MSRLQRGYGQRLWRSQRPPRPTGIIYNRSPTPVQEALHRTGAHLHHSHASRARATGSASHRPPLDSRRSVQLIRHLPRRVGGQPAAGGTARQGHTAKGTCGRPKACARGWWDRPPNTPLREQGAMTPVPDTGTGHTTNRARAPRGSPPQLQHGQTARAGRMHRNNRSTTRAARERTQK